MQLARSLSFSRRRNRSVASPDQKNLPGTPTEAGSEGSTPSEADGPYYDAPSGPAGRLTQLCSQLNKRHNYETYGLVKGHTKRWFEVDDNLGCLFQFTNHENLERRVPHHVYALGDMSKVVELQDDARTREDAGCLMFKFGDDFHQSSGKPFQIICQTGDRSLMHRWISGMTARLLRQREDGAPRARTVWVDTLLGERRGGERKGEEKTAADDDSDAVGSEDDGDGFVTSLSDGPPPSSRPPPIRTPSPPSRTPINGHPTQPKAKGLGVRMRNTNWSCIGALLDNVEPGSPAHIAGLRTNDVIVAVGGTACFSHLHACRLLADSFNPVELIVWKPHGGIDDAATITSEPEREEVAEVY